MKLGLSQKGVTRCNIRKSITMLHCVDRFAMPTSESAATKHLDSWEYHRPLLVSATLEISRQGPEPNRTVSDSFCGSLCSSLAAVHKPSVSCFLLPPRRMSQMPRDKICVRWVQTFPLHAHISEASISRTNATDIASSLLIDDMPAYKK